GRWAHVPFIPVCAEMNRTGEPLGNVPPSFRGPIMGAEQKARKLGISFPIKEKGYLNLCVRSGNLLITSARECAIKVLQSVRQAHGTLDGLRVLKLLGCVSSTPDFTDQHLVVNGASDLLHELFGKDAGAGRYSARSRGH